MIPETWKICVRVIRTSDFRAFVENFEESVTLHRKYTLHVYEKIYKVFDLNVGYGIECLVYSKIYIRTKICRD